MFKRLLAVAVLALAAVPSFAATLYIDEYAQNPYVTYQAVLTPPVASQTVAIGGSSAQSAAFNSLTRIIRIHTDAICSVLIGGTNPTATTSNARMTAGQTEYFVVQPGQKLAVISNT